MNNYDPKLVGAVTDRGLHRAENEDALWQPDRTSPVHLGALYIVADGVGGQEHGGIAARMVVAVLSEAFYRAREQGQDMAQSLQFGIAQANQAVFDEAQANQVRMGATVVTAVHHEGQLYIAHVGDSRAYLLTGQTLELLTRDDSVVQRQLDAGVITEAEAAQHQFRNLVTQVLGNTLKIDIHLAEPQPFAAGDTLLLCSDGLSGVVDTAIIQQILAEAPASLAASTLVEAAKEAGSQDNITAVVVSQSSQQTVPLVATPNAADKLKKERGMWLWGGMVVFFFVVMGLLWWQRSQAPTANGADEVTTEAVVPADAIILPTPDETMPTPDLTSVADMAETAVVAASSTPDPAVLSQADTTKTAVPSPELSATPSPTPANIGCVDPNIEIVYVWAKADLTVETCANALAQQSLTTGESVLVLEATPQTLPAPGFCAEVAFVEVQSQVDETVSGWVLETQILRDEACP
jgi:protein phosphatase